MTLESEPCDRCGATIVFGPFEHPYHFQFHREVPADTEEGGLPDYEVEDRLLCDACEKEMLAWIDDAGSDSTDSVDLPNAVEAAEVIAQATAEMEKVGDTLREEFNMNPEDTDD